MSIFLNGGKKVNGIFANVNGETKKIVSAWVNKEGLPVKVFSGGMKPRFVTVGASGNAYYSTDGETWVAMSGLDTSITYYGVTYGNGRFICVGASGNAYYSTDGETWTAMSGVDNPITYYGVTYDGEKFIAVGNRYSQYSTDGINWADGVAFNGTARGVAYGNGKFLGGGASGKYCRSTDGISWSVSSKGSNDYYGTTYGNGKFVTVGESGTSYTTAENSNLLSIAMSGLASVTYYGVTYGNGRFICVGASGNAYYSTDGETWVAMSGLASATYNGICFSIDGGYDNS